MNRLGAMKAAVLAAAASALAIASGTGAQAADLLAIKAPPPPAPFSWTGFYIGAHAGYGWGNENDNQSVFFLPGSGGGGSGGDSGGSAGGGDGGNDAFHTTGFVGGLHAGYNWQAGSLVLGLEGDIDYSAMDGSASTIYGAGPYAATLSLSANWQASIRARVGYALDTWLFYGTGGVAFANADLRGYGLLKNIWVDNSDSNTATGWTLGGGIEHAFTPNWLGRIEARYTDFGSKTYNLGPSGLVTSSWNQTVVTAGISYKF